MRADLKDVIVDTGRYKNGEKKTSSLKGLREEQIETLPEKQGMRKNHTGWGFEFGDRTNPLFKFLRKNVGRPWADVWSEICEHCDNRTIRGKHLRDHVRQDVYGSGGEEAYGRFYGNRPFYVDEDGILQSDGRTNRWWIGKRRAPQYDPDKCKIGDNHYERINACWFQTWYETVERGETYWNYMMNRKEVRYVSEEVLVRKKQLSKRELKALGLKNDPEFKWWNK